MNRVTKLAVLGLMLSTSACGILSKGQNKSYDGGLFDNKPLDQLVAGIWVDPNGCQHWIIDDGVEGYLSARLQPNGKPVCNNQYPRNQAIGNFKGKPGLNWDPV